MTDDPLEGFRGPSIGLARQIETIDPASELWSRLYLGDAAQRIMRAVADRKDIGKVMATLIAQCELDAQLYCKQLIECDDLDKPEARRAHFDARVSAGILGRINQLVNDGIAAGEAINNQQEN